MANLFIDRNVDRLILGHTIPPMAFISLESIFIFLIGPIDGYIMEKNYMKNKLNIARFTIYFSFRHHCFIVTIFGNWGYISLQGGLVNPIWVVICYFIITIGELMLSPIGLSMVTQLAPSKFVGLMMGVWFLGSYGGLLAGVLGKLASVPQTH